MKDMSKQDQKLERIYTVPLTQAWITARHRRTKRAVRVLREFAERHMKSSEIKIDQGLNEKLWSRGITKPPRRITVMMERDEDGVITVSLPKAEKPAVAKEEPTEQAPSKAVEATKAEAESEEEKTKPAKKKSSSKSSKKVPVTKKSKS